MHSKSFLAIILLCTINSAFCMEPQPSIGLFARMRNKVYSACNSLGSSVSSCALATKNLALVSLKWAWNKKITFALGTGQSIVGKYANQFPGVKYVNQKFKGYFGSEEGLAQTLMRSRLSDVALQATLYGANSFKQTIESNKGIFDSHMFLRTLGKEIGTDFLHVATLKILSDKIKLPNAPGSIRLAATIGTALGSCIMREAIRDVVVNPCMYFEEQVRSKGLSKAFNSLLTNGQPAS